MRKAPQKKKKRARDERKKVQKHANNKLDESNPIQDDSAEKTDAIAESLDAHPSTSENVATSIEHKLKGSRIFLLPITAKQINKKFMSSVRTMLSKYIEENKGFDIQHVLKTLTPNVKGLEFLKMFGTLNDLNELLDQEGEYELSMLYYITSLLFKYPLVPCDIRQNETIILSASF